MTDITEQLAEALRLKLENIISGYRINDDDAAWLRSAAYAALAHRPEQPAQGEREAFERHKLMQGWPASEIAAICSKGAPRAGEYMNTRMQDDWELWQARAALAQQPAARVALTEAKPERRFPMQRGPSIPWTLAEAIYAGYSALFGNSQSLERLAERGGFSWPEVEYIYNHRDKSSKAAIDAAIERAHGITAPAAQEKQP